MIHSLRGHVVNTCSTSVKTFEGTWAREGKSIARTQCRVWLTRTVKLSQYINNFVDNGYDDINIAAEMITADKLIKIGINKMGHRDAAAAHWSDITN